jgi:hypothetical protein
LCIDVIQIGSSVLDRQRSQRVEVKKIRSLEIAVAVAQARSGDNPDIKRP